MSNSSVDITYWIIVLNPKQRSEFHFNCVLMRQFPCYLNIDSFTHFFADKIDLIIPNTTNGYFIPSS